MAAYIKLLMLCLLFLVFGTQKSSALQPVNNGVAVTTAVKSHTHNVPSFDNSGHDLFDFNQGILLKKSVSDSANPYKQGNNFHPAIKTDAQRPITFKVRYILPIPSVTELSLHKNTMYLRSGISLFSTFCITAL